MEVIPFLVIIVVLGVILRLIAGRIDVERVEDYILDMDCKLLDTRWTPFGPGWLGESGSRIYKIIYRDGEGRVHEEHAKTSMMSGVYLTNDRIIEDSTDSKMNTNTTTSHQEPIEKEQRPGLSLEEEKAALRKRLAEIERLQKDHDLGAS